MKMKKAFSIALLMCVLLAALCPIAMGEQRDNIRENSTIYQLELSELGRSVYSEGEGGVYGPEDFIVLEDETALVLDTQNRRIIVCKDSGISYIDISQHCLWPSRIEYSDGKIYVLDAKASSVLVFSTDGKIVQKMGLPDGVNGYIVVDLQENDGNIILRTDFDGNYMIKGNSFVPVSINESAYTDNQRVLHIKLRNGSEITLNTAHTGADVVYSDDRYAVLECIELVPDCPFVMGELTLRRFSTSSGKLIGCEYLDSDEWFSMPSKYTSADRNGAVYYMACYADKIQIKKACFSKTPADSRMDEIRQEAMIKTRELIASEKNTAPNYRITKKRNQVLSTAQSYANHTWTLREYNKHTYGNAQLYHAYANASDGTRFTGVPYCRGGYHTVSQFDQYLNTVYQSPYKYCAGNVNDQGYQNGTTGVDCSGFVSRAYGISHYTTSGLAGYGNAYTTGYSAYDMKPMDMWVASGYHVMLHVGYANNNTRVYVYDASREAVGCVSYRYWSYAGIQSHNFMKRSPWHLSCSGYVNSTYTQTPTTHYHECSVCGMKYDEAPHTWVTSGTNKVCTVCGRTVAVQSAPGAVE